MLAPTGTSKQASTGFIIILSDFVMFYCPALTLSIFGFSCFSPSQKMKRKMWLIAFPVAIPKSVSKVKFTFLCKMFFLLFFCF